MVAIPWRALYEGHIRHSLSVLKAFREYGLADEAADLEGAIIAGKQQCIDDWSCGYKDSESPWNMASVHCLGVAAGDVDILHWRDQPQ